MNDRPLTLVLIAVAILVALWIRRKGQAIIPGGASWVKSGTSRLDERGVTVEPISTRVDRSELLPVDVMKREGEARGIHVDVGAPMTREQFERFLGPVSVP